MGQSLTKDHGTTRELINAGDAELIRKVNRNFTLSSPACIALAALVSLGRRAVMLTTKCELHSHTLTATGIESQVDPATMKREQSTQFYLPQF